MESLKQDLNKNDAKTSEISKQEETLINEEKSTVTTEVSKEEETPRVLSETQNNIAARRNNKEVGKKLTPPNVKVPLNTRKNFDMFEKYKSPTDSIMSPASRVVFSRNKKAVRPMELPPYLPPKVPENSVPVAGEESK